MSKIKVCILTTDHSALDDRIFYKESRSLRQAGYEITLLAPLTNEDFLVDMGGNKIGRSEVTIENIRIIGFNKLKQRFNRIYSVLQLIKLAGVDKFDSRRDNYKDLINKAIESNADIYHCHEIWSLYVGIQIKKELQKKGRNSKLIYDVHEFHPAITYDVKNYMDRLYNWFLRRIIVHFEKKALKYTDYVITANQITRGYLLTLNRFIQVEVIYNCPVLSILQEQKRVNKNENKVVICHEGFLLFRRGLKQIIEVMRVLKKRYGSKIELLIVGDTFGDEKEYINKKLDEYNLQDTIKCSGWLPYKKVGEALSQADIGIIFFEPTENNMLAGPPHKLFNYMRYRLPVVSVNLPETNRIISEVDCGIIIKDWDLNSMINALSKLIDNRDERHRLSENAKMAISEHYNWNQMEKKLLKVYEKMHEDIKNSRMKSDG
jgi:glycosyltransferase involved in cell wall biosynthesis